MVGSRNKGGEAEGGAETVAWGAMEGAGTTVPPVGGLELCAIDDVSSFRTASGEFIEDGGAVKIRGFLESGSSCTMNARKADVHT
eukprot:54423-Amphidinium_carterae.6